MLTELRKDPVVGRWVIIATKRARRPGNFVNPEENYFDQEDTCPFCNNTEPEIFTVKEDGQNWNVKVVNSGTPILKPQGKCKRTGNGIYDVINGFGVQEVVIETPEHIANMADLDVAQIRRVINTYVARFNALKESNIFSYMMAYKNYGWAAGSRRIGHARSQILAAPITPIRAKEKLQGAKHYFEYRDRCMLCDMIQQELEEKKRVVLETEHFVVLTPYAPRFPFELAVYPKKHCCHFAEGVAGVEEDLAYVLKDVLKRLQIGLEDPAYNYVIHSAPETAQTKKDRWRTLEEDYHWHIEVTPRLTVFAGFEKGSGFYICPIPPEAAAEFLRNVKI